MLLILLIIQWAPEKHDVRFWPVNCIVYPATRLLDAKGPPFTLREKTILRKQFGDIGWQNDMPILVDIIIILLRVLDLRHGEEMGKGKWSRRRCEEAADAEKQK